MGTDNFLTLYLRVSWGGPSGGAAPQSREGNFLKKGRQLSKYHLLKLYQLSRMDSAVRRSTRVPQPSSKGKAVGLDAASTSNAKRSRVAETAARKKAEEDAAKLLQAEAAKRTRDKNKKDAADAAKKKAAALAKGKAAAAAQPRVAKKKTAVSAPGEAAHPAQPQVAQVAQPERLVRPRGTVGLRRRRSLRRVPRPRRLSSRLSWSATTSRSRLVRSQLPKRP